jgi:hypothetical protein
MSLALFFILFILSSCLSTTTLNQWLSLSLTYSENVYRLFIDTNAISQRDEMKQIDIISTKNIKLFRSFIIFPFFFLLLIFSYNSFLFYSLFAFFFLHSRISNTQLIFISCIFCVVWNELFINKYILWWSEKIYNKTTFLRRMKYFLWIRHTSILFTNIRPSL